MPRGGSKPGERRGGRKKGTPNKVTAKMRGTFAETVKHYSDEALQILVTMMKDATVTASTRVRCAELIIERAHGKLAAGQDSKPKDFIPLAERLAIYAREEKLEASADKVVEFPVDPSRPRKDH
jgi:hypothetical protein